MSKQIFALILAASTLSLADTVFIDNSMAASQKSEVDEYEERFAIGPYVEFTNIKMDNVNWTYKVNNRKYDVDVSNTFTFGGKGQDGGRLKAYVNPQHVETVSPGHTVSLTAYAPGASSYRWLMDGVPVSGGTDGTLDAGWAKGGTRTEEGHQHSYQAIAIFDFDGVSRESEPSAPETVTSTFHPFTIIFR